MPSRPLSFDTRKDLIDFKKQMEKTTGKECTKAEYQETGYVKKKRKSKIKKKPEVYLEEFAWRCPNHDKKLVLARINSSDKWSPSVGYCKKCKMFYCLPTVGHPGMIIEFNGKQFHFCGIETWKAEIAGVPKIVII